MLSDTRINLKFIKFASETWTL